ncbi:putative outer membrane starch-binding protein [Mucilaginibacter yixingensis]|uniref:Putative outer membrane starch-binding protein n=1 Tax=Mucilaginibacter yixingensis TaxID=1295612 RepID=A0A2T5JAK2_9SPHI|nr:RagB/SusD family nutrient uptake outer membrane protein [Mucilaginibacter yixingensis]PTQ97884.1 putative outer membrane starch-binding protein [Mucilaginibacter yixingensis]
MKKLFILIALLPFCMFSCKKSGFLDDKTNGLTADAVFTDSVQTLNFLNKIYVDAGYSFGPSRFAGAGGTGNTELATDNTEGTNNTAVWADSYVRGSIGPSNVITSTFFATDKDFWNTPYKNIRRVNLLLSKLPNAPFSDAMKKRIRGEIRFLRAYYYHYMVVAFGGVPLISDQVYNIDDIINIPRNSFADCINYITSELDAAASDLNGVVYSDIDYGRVTRGACLALKSRVLLYAASPLFNGGSIATNANVQPLTGYTTYDKNRWQLAADAASAVMNLGQYSLYVDNTTRPGYGFYQVFLKRVNSEYIFAYNRPAQKEFETYYLPPSRSGSSIQKPTESLVEAFPMKDGKTIKQSTSYNPNDPYTNRDPRLDNSIIYNGQTYMSNTGTKTQVFTYTSTGSAISNTTADAYTTANKFTGYFARKMLDENLTNSLSGTTERAWPLIRYAEILLNYAEAINETGQTDKAYAPLIALRNRAGITPGTDNLYGLKANMTVDEMREIIHTERRIELAFEDHRWNDIRRWKIASSVLTGFNSVDIITRTGTSTYVHTIGSAPRILAFRDAMYLLPIPLSEIQKMPLMLQNPGY